MGLVERICGGDECMTISVSPLTQLHLEVSFKLATEVFIEGSTLHRALGIGLDEYRTYLRPSFEEMIEEELSVAALDSTSGELVGCVIATDFHQHLNPEIELGSKFAPLAALTRELCVQYRQVRTIASGDAVLVDMGVVGKHHAGQGIYQMMRRATQSIAKGKRYTSVVGELSSASTQHVILNRLGHQKLAEVKFSNFEFSGTHPFQTIREPQSIILAEGAL